MNNHEKANRLISTWPEWKKKVTLTKYSEEKRMTSKVTVSAHCPESTHVLVGVTENTGEAFVLNNGETKEFYVYGDQRITVCEEPKEQAS